MMPNVWIAQFPFDRIMWVGKITQVYEGTKEIQKLVYIMETAAKIVQYHHGVERNV